MAMNASAPVQKVSSRELDARALYLRCSSLVIDRSGDQPLILFAKV